MNGPPSRGRRRWLLGAFACFAPFVRCASAARAPAPERLWLDRSAALAEAARHHAAVGDFRRRIEEHRGWLRRIVLADGDKAPPALLQLHRSMILVNALLHAAAECEVGGRLVCPADLMRQLDAQIAQGLAQCRSLPGAG